MTTAKKKLASVLIEIPLGEVDENAYRPRHVDVTNMTATQGDAIKRVLEGLQSNAIRLKSGRFVQNQADAVRFILERIAEKGGLSNGH